MPGPDTSEKVGIPEAPSAVVVNYNAGETIARCLASLRQAGISDIVVVDNGSSDGSVDRVQEEAFSARVVRPTRNIGYGAGANLGVKHASGGRVFICNPDLVVEPGAMEHLNRALGARPDAAVVGPMLLEPDGSVYPSGRSFPGLGDALGHGFVGLFWRDNPWTRRYRLVGESQHTARDADWVSGAGFLVRRDAFEAVGGFDEAYFMYVEDVDLCWRLHRAGWAILYEPSAHVVHEQGVSTSLHPYRMLAAHHRSILRFARRSGSGRERFLLPLVAVALGARFALASLRCFLAERRDRPVQTRDGPFRRLFRRSASPLGSRPKDAGASRG
ncbi:MAG: glycosyltransferase family 2 protein [Acidimicrobiales bacterium]